MKYYKAECSVNVLEELYRRTKLLTKSLGKT